MVVIQVAPNGEATTLDVGPSTSFLWIFTKSVIDSPLTGGRMLVILDRLARCIERTSRVPVRYACPGSSKYVQHR